MVEVRKVRPFQNAFASKNSTILTSKSIGIQHVGSCERSGGDMATKLRGKFVFFYTDLSMNFNSCCIVLIHETSIVK